MPLFFTPDRWHYDRLQRYGDADAVFVFHYYWRWRNIDITPYATPCLLICRCRQLRYDCRFSFEDIFLRAFRRLLFLSRRFILEERRILLLFFSRDMMSFSPFRLLRIFIAAAFAIFHAFSSSLPLPDIPSFWWWAVFLPIIYILLIVGNIYYSGSPAGFWYSPSSFSFLPLHFYQFCRRRHIFLHITWEYMRERGGRCIFLPSLPSFFLLLPSFLIYFPSSVMICSFSTSFPQLSSSFLFWHFLLSHRAFSLLSATTVIFLHCFLLTTLGDQRGWHRLFPQSSHVVIFSSMSHDRWAMFFTFFFHMAFLRHGGNRDDFEAEMGWWKAFLFIIIWADAAFFSFSRRG